MRWRTATGLRSTQMSVAICMNESQLLLTSSHLDDIIQRYVFPVQFILGVTGNCINLIVLLSKGMRSEVRHLLPKKVPFDIEHVVNLCNSSNTSIKRVSSSFIDGFKLFGKHLKMEHHSAVFERQQKFAH